jgi:hypothetical protein
MDDRNRKERMPLKQRELKDHQKKRHDSHLNQILKIYPAVVQKITSKIKEPEPKDTR